MKYDYLIVGAGLFGSIFANLANAAGKKCLVIDRREHIGGNICDKEIEGIQVHLYGPHIFHTNCKKVWDYVQRFAEFRTFTYSPIANYYGELYNLPFNMNTFSKMWGIVTPDEARNKIESQRLKITEPKNLEEQALTLIGRDIYEKLIKGYTEKQWGRPAKELPPFIIRRLPLRFTFDNNYFSDRFQGIPIGGYTKMVENMLCGIEVQTNTDYLSDREYYDGMADRIIFTGQIDEYFDYIFGSLEYRSLLFETEIHDVDNYQGAVAINYTDSETKFTRSIEYKHFECGKGNAGTTVITREYPARWERGKEAFYPVNDERNNQLYERYARYGKEQKNIIFGGRLGTYKYLNMDEVIMAAFDCARNEMYMGKRSENDGV